MRNYALAKRIMQEVSVLKEEGRFADTMQYIQHGNVSVYRHCLAVAYMSFLLVDYFKLEVDRKALLRGALLHDYFLYDWHENVSEHRLHGFFHPKKALINAQKDFKLTHTEKNIILRHMFPLTPIPPACTEAWIVCMADKICATKETMWTINNIRQHFITALLKCMRNGGLHENI